MSASLDRAVASLDTKRHDQRLARRLKNPEYRREFVLQKRRLTAIDAIVTSLDELREAQGFSKAALAREINKNPAAIRRLLTALGNPELGTVVALADALDADVVVVPRKQPA